MQTISYRGYSARVQYDARDGLLVGRVLEVADIISFHGATEDELYAAFVVAVEDWLADEPAAVAS